MPYVVFPNHDDVTTSLGSVFEERLAWRYVVDHHQWEQLPKFRYSIWFYCDLRVRVRETLEMFDHALAVLRAGPTTAAGFTISIGHMTLNWVIMLRMKLSEFYRNLKRARKT